MSYPCPQCGGRYTQSIAMMYSDNTRRWRDFRGRNHSSQSDLAARYSPPQRRGTRGPTILLALIGTALLSVLYLVSIVVEPQVSNFQSQTLAKSSHPSLFHPRHKAHNAKPESVPLQQQQPAVIMNVPDPSSQFPTRYILLFSAALLSISAFPIWSIRRTDRYNRTVWAAEIERWNALFLCKACGQVFVLHNEAAGSTRY
jgi:hypothetical protein